VSTISQEQIALLTDYDVTTAYSRAYHNLYANICFDWDKTKYKQFAILPAYPVAYSGQETVAANLAIAAAQSGTPTLLIDADAYHPHLQQRFNIDTNMGFSQLLMEKDILPQTLLPYLSKTFITDLCLLRAGPISPHSQEIHGLFSTKLQVILCAIRQFLEETEQRPSLIVFNSSSVLEGIETSLISTLVEQTFLIITSGHTTRKQAKQAQEQLQRAHAKLAGMILLDV